MNFSDIKRIGFVVLLGLMILLLAVGFFFQANLLNLPFEGTPADGEPPSLEPLNQPSPDGKYIAGVTAENAGMSSSQITLAREGAKDVQVIAAGDENSWVTNPIWSPDGKTVAYLRVVIFPAGDYEVDSRYELWVYDVASGENRLVTDSETLNPSISFDGNADIKWVSDTQIQYPDNESFPTLYTTIDIHTLETTSDESLPHGGVVVAAQPGTVPYFSQCDSAWGSKILGTCSQYTICEQGCAISSVAMIFKYFGISTDPGKINEWLKANGGYSSGCLINWATAANLAPDKLTWVARVDKEDWSRLRYELDNGYPVVIEVPFSNGQHFVVATGYSGDTVFINDPYYTSRTTLDSYGNHFKGLRIYHGPTSEPASCPAPTDTQVYVCEPVLTPVYNDNPCVSQWVPIKGFSGFPNYLVENAATEATGANSGVWTPNLPASGRYTVEAFISAHGTFSKTCSWGSMTFGADSSKAKYMVTGSDGVATEVVRDQLPMNDEWLSLGEFYFDEGKNGFVTLTDVTGEPESSRNLSFGAMRFTLVGPPDYAVPVVNGFSPALTTAGEGDFTLTLNGSGFYPESVVRWNGNDRATTYISKTELTALISAEDIATAGMMNVTVFNPTPGGGESTAVIFPVIKISPEPTDTQVYVYEPDLTPVYNDNPCVSQWVPIKGFSGFPNYLVENAATEATGANSGIWMPNLPASGRYTVEAFISAHETFSKTCSWGSMTFGADSSKAKYMVTGSDGVATEVVRDQLPMSDEWLSLGEFYFDEGKNGFVTLTDVTGEPESSRNLSFGAMRFTLVGPPDYAVPVVNGFSPALTTAGESDFTLTLNGSGFYPESVVRWNGNDRATTYISKTELTALISTEDIATAGMMNVTVFNPTPGGGESTAVIFPVINISPAKLEVLTASKVTFDWDDITGANQYEIQVSKAQDFSTTLFSAKTGESMYVYNTYLKYSTGFFWRLKYEKDGVWSAWSPAWKFTSRVSFHPPVPFVFHLTWCRYPTRFFLMWK